MIEVSFHLFHTQDVSFLRDGKKWKRVSMKSLTGVSACMLPVNVAMAIIDKYSHV